MITVEQFPRVRAPFVTRAEMAEVDRLMVEELGIDLARMMENAGRSLAHLARVLFLDGNPVGKTVTVLAGRGGNGGGALVAARRLHGWGARVQIVLAGGREEGAGPAGEQLAILRRLGVRIRAEGEPATLTQELVVDGLIGYGLSGPPRGRVAALIEWTNRQDAPVLSLDLPSGLDASAGLVTLPIVRATATLTLALPKVGLAAAGADAFVGKLFLADLGVPPSLYSGPSLNREVGPLFALSDIVRIHGFP